MSIINASCIQQPTFQTFSKILNFRHQLAAAKPIIGAYWNKWYQNTEKSNLHPIKQEKSKVIQIKKKTFQIHNYLFIETDKAYSNLSKLIIDTLSLQPS